MNTSSTITKVQQPTESDNESENESESENDSDCEQAFDMNEDDDINIADLMQTFFAGENGKNIVDTVESLKQTIDQQNKILMKIGGLFEKYISNK